MENEYNLQTQINHDETPVRSNRGRGGFRGRGFRGGRSRGGFRNNYKRDFVLDFNRFVNRPEIQKKIMENFQERLNKGDTKELFHWAAPPLNNCLVGETIYIRFNKETEIHSYLITAKFMRGEIQWKNSMPDSVRFEYRLKKIN